VISYLFVYRVFKRFKNNIIGLKDRTKPVAIIIGHAGDCLFSIRETQPRPYTTWTSHMAAITTAEIERNEKSVPAAPRHFAAVRVVVLRGWRRRKQFRFKSNCVRGRASTVHVDAGIAWVLNTCGRHARNTCAFFPHCSYNWCVIVFSSQVSSSSSSYSAPERLFIINNNILLRSP